MNDKGAFRYKRILDLFTEERSVWTVAELSAQLGTAVSTLYRQVSELVAIGFLEGTVDAQYRLGPAFVEFERRARRTDPLILAGEFVLNTLVSDIGVECSVLLARLYGNKVMCVADAHSQGMMLKSSFERGLPMPLERSATARAALSAMDSRRLRRLLERETELSGDRLKKYQSELFQIRKDGYWIAESEVDLGAVAIATPVANRRLGVEASLTVVSRAKDLQVVERPAVARRLKVAAREIEAFLESQAVTLSQNG